MWQLYIRQKSLRSESLQDVVLINTKVVGGWLVRRLDLCTKTWRRTLTLSLCRLRRTVQCLREDVTATVTIAIHQVLCWAPRQPTQPPAPMGRRCCSRPPSATLRAIPRMGRPAQVVSSCSTTRKDRLVRNRIRRRRRASRRWDWSADITLEEPSRRRRPRRRRQRRLQQRLPRQRPRWGWPRPTPCSPWSRRRHNPPVHSPSEVLPPTGSPWLTAWPPKRRPPLPTSCRPVPVFPRDTFSRAPSDLVNSRRRQLTGLIRQRSTSQVHPRVTDRRPFTEVFTDFIRPPTGFSTQLGPRVRRTVNFRSYRHRGQRPECQWMRTLLSTSVSFQSFQFPLYTLERKYLSKRYCELLRWIAGCPTA